MIDPKLRDEVREQLVKALGEPKVLWKKADLLPYTKDTYRIRFDEDYKHFPDFVVLPETTSEVQATVGIAGKHRIPLIPKGGGSNRTGMLVPIHGGIIVDTVKMAKVLEVSTPNLYVTVQPGITLKELEEHLAEHGLALNQEQGSFKVATVGGAISTAGFSRKHQKYGTIADRVMSLEVVLADGRVLRTGPKVLYTSTGYRLQLLFVGAEGTLGIITEATLRVEPLPESKDVLLAYYDDFWEGLGAAEKVMASCVTFVGGELYELGADASSGAPPDKKVAFCIAFEGTSGEVRAEVEFVRNILEEARGVLGGREEAARIIDGYTMRWCGERALLDPEDEINAYVPMERLREFYEKVWSEIVPKHGIRPVPGSRYGLDVGRYRMAYSRLYVPEGEQGWDSYRKAMSEVAQLATALGGSISSCTGVGLKHRDDLGFEFSEVALDTMWAIKRELDPQNIMNPGKKLPPRGVRNRQ